MTVEAIAATAVERIDFVPQAVIKKPVAYFVAEMRVPFVRGHDDLDEYEGAAFSLNGLPFAIRHYKGHPADVVTIYLPSRFEDVGEITAILSTIIDELPISRADLLWQRADNPDL
jgi:hypothetical protein